MKGANQKAVETSLVLQWLRLHDPKALVQSLVREVDPECCNWEFTCCKEDRRSRMPQLRPSAAKQTNKFFKKKLTKGMYCMTLFLWSAKIGKIHPWRKKCINSCYLVWCIQLSSYIQWSKLLNKMFNSFWWITYKWHLN